MDIIRKITTLTDESLVHDVDILSNGRLDGRCLCIFSCHTEENAEKFLDGLTELIERYTVESVSVKRDPNTI